MLLWLNRLDMYCAEKDGHHLCFIPAVGEQPVLLLWLNRLKAYCDSKREINEFGG